MTLAQGRYWKATKVRDGSALALEVLRDGLAGDLEALRGLIVEVPLDHWNQVVKLARPDRKLLGGRLLDFANDADQLSAAIASDRVCGELQRVILEATTSLIEEGGVVVVPQGADSSAGE